MSERRIRRHPEALWVHTLRGVVILPPGADDATTVTSPGDIVWQLIEEPHSVSDIVDRLAEVFDEPLDALQTDVERFLSDLGDLGALEQTPQV